MKNNSIISITLMTSLVIVYLLINLVFIYYIGAYAWDDGAITLAYGQTIAHYGKFALTGASEIVEGSSSLSLIFLTAVVTKLFHFDFYNLITWSQINTLIFTVMTLWLTYTLIARNFKNKNYALSITFLVGLFPMYSAEIMNGMEMTLFSTLLLLFILAYEKKSVSLYLLIPLLLLTRFESIFYLGLTLLALLIFDKNNRNFILKIMLTTIVCFILFSLLRYDYFGDFMPNTIWAKMHTPYSSPDLFQKIEGGKDFFDVFNLMLVMLFLFLLKRNKEQELKDIKFWLIISFFIFSLVTGKNWGYTGRMFLAVLPIIAIFFILQVSNFSELKLTLSNQTMCWTASEKAKFIIIIAVLLIALIANKSLWLTNIQVARTGGYYQGKYLPEFIYNKYYKKLPVIYDFGITPENYKITGTTVDEIRLNLGLKTIKFMVPDVGGTSLCCEKINIIDSALLTNQYLAKHGYDNFGILLEKERPDIIETHSIWSSVTKIYSEQYFQNNYIPLIADMSFLWLNKKYLEILIKQGSLEKISKYNIPKKTRYLGHPIDNNFLERYSGDIYTFYE